MRELSHQISVFAAAWPGGQQDGREQLLAGDILWTHRGALGGWGGGVFSGERAMKKDRAAVCCVVQYWGKREWRVR